MKRVIITGTHNDWMFKNIPYRYDIKCHQFLKEVK